MQFEYFSYKHDYRYRGAVNLTCDLDTDDLFAATYLRLVLPPADCQFIA